LAAAEAIDAQQDMSIRACESLMQYVKQPAAARNR
jgi:hypothetical protein